MTVPIVVDTHFIELQVQLKLLFESTDGEHRVSGDAESTYIGGLIAMDVKFYRYEPHDIEICSLCALAIIVPKEALYLVEVEGWHLCEHAIECHVGVFKITFVDAVEHNDTIGRENDARTLDTVFTEGKLDLSVALEAKRAAQTLVEGVGF